MADGDIILDFGASAIALTGAHSTYTVTYSTDKKVGADNGSTCYAIMEMSAHKYLEFSLPEIDELFAGTENLVMSVYWETATGTNLPFIFRDGPYSTASVESRVANLTPNAWTQVVMPVGGKYEEELEENSGSFFSLRGDLVRFFILNYKYNRC